MSSGGRLAIDFVLEYPIGEFDIPDVHTQAGAINAGIANSKRDIILK
jgi:hypothetical protein